MSDIKIGDRFGRWTVIGEAKKKYYSLCKCDCGTVREVNNSTLRLGKSLSCGCRQAEDRKKTYTENLIGKRKGRLVVLERTEKKDKKGNPIYLCQCDCGNVVELSSRRLIKRARTNSCGCLRKERGKEEKEKLVKYGNENREKFVYDGTKIDSLTMKVPSSSTTGYKGVSRVKKTGRYRAYINLRRKQINLGFFKSLEEAVEARKEAEKKYYDPVIEEWEETRKK